MKYLLVVGLIFSSGVAFSFELQSGKFECDDDSTLELVELKAKFHDISQDEREISGLSILNSGNAIKLNFDKGDSVLCHKSKAEILFL